MAQQYVGQSWLVIDRRQVAKLFFALGLLLMPLSYSTKSMFSLDVTWVDPTLVLGVIALVLIGVSKLRGTYTILLVFSSALSAVAGWIYLLPSHTREHSALYVVANETFKLALNLIWFAVARWMFKNERRYALKWLSVTVIWEAIIALIFQLTLLGYFNIAGPISAYLELYKLRQAVWFGDFPIYRVAGTFIEAPPFGLFSFCCFVIFLLEITRLSRASEPVPRWWRIVASISLVGAISSLSDSVLLAVTLLASYLIRKHSKNSIASSALLTLLFLAAVSYVGFQVTKKVGNAVEETVDSDIKGSSGAERMYHMRLGAKLLAENPLAIVTGIGPGRYGDYCETYGLFPSSTTIQVTPVEWIVEYGVIGLAIIIIWLAYAGKSAVRTFGNIGFYAFISLVIAVLFQASWKWEGWFTALAFLAAYSVTGNGRSRTESLP